MHFDTDVFSNKGKFLMLALDHRGSFKKLINKDNPDAVSQEEVTATKQSIVKAVEGIMSGFLIDPPTLEGSDPLKRSVKPYLLCIEKTGYVEEGLERKTELEYSVEQLKGMGARGIKLLLYVHPEALVTHYQIELARSVLEDSHTHSLPLFLELVTYPIPDKHNHKPEIVLESVNRFVEAGVIPDVFKLEYPGDPAGCFAITKMLKKTPWILLTRGDKFDLFVEELRIAVSNGCTGFLAGRALWQEFSQYKTFEERNIFFQSTMKDRFRIIKDIVANS